jgi:hypothetical protein
MLYRFLLIVLLTLTGLARATQPDEPHSANPPAVELHLFWSLQSPHCLEARPQMLDLVRQQPWIHLHDYELTQHPAHVDQFIQMARALGEEAQAVPTLIFCRQMQVGWDDSAAGQAALLAALENCRDSGSGADNQPSPPDKPTRLALPLVGDIDPATLSLPALTVLVAGLDAFNPCAFFVLLFLLSLLTHQQNRQRMILIGGIFVAFSGLMYFAFMAAWLNLFLFFGQMPWVTGGAGLLAIVLGSINIKDFVALRKGVSLSLDERQRNDIFKRARRVLNAGNTAAMIAATVFLAIAANFYELLCTAGFPMVFTRLLTLQVASRSEQYFYLALYNLIYVTPLLLIVFAFVRSMGSRKLSEREGRLLKLLSGLMMLLLGLLLAFAPEKLNDFSTTAGLVALAVGLTLIAARWTKAAP